MYALKIHLLYINDNMRNLALKTYKDYIKNVVDLIRKFYINLILEPSS